MSILGTNDEEIIKTFENVLLMNTKMEGKCILKTIQNIFIFWFYPYDPNEKELFIKLQQIEYVKMKKQSILKEKESLLQIITEIGMIINPMFKFQTYDDFSEFILILHDNRFEFEPLNASKDWMIYKCILLEEGGSVYSTPKKSQYLSEKRSVLKRRESLKGNDSRPSTPSHQKGSKLSLHPSNSPKNIPQNARTPPSIVHSPSIMVEQLQVSWNELRKKTTPSLMENKQSENEMIDKNEIDIVKQHGYTCGFTPETRVENWRKCLMYRYKGIYWESVAISYQLDMMNLPEWRETCVMINKDIPRTEIKKKFIKSNTEEYKKVERLLKAFCAINQSVGFIQGMVDVLSILCKLETREEVIFELFCGIMQIIFTGCMDMNSFDTHRFSFIVETLNKNLYNHVMKTCIDFSFTINWLIVLFKREFTLQSLLRVWDSIIAYPERKFQLFIAATILISQSNTIQTSVQSTDELMIFMNSIPNTIPVEIIHQADMYYNVFNSTAPPKILNRVFKKADYRHWYSPPKSKKEILLSKYLSLSEIEKENVHKEIGKMIELPEYTQIDCVEDQIKRLILQNQFQYWLLSLENYFNTNNINELGENESINDVENVSS